MEQLWFEYREQLWVPSSLELTEMLLCIGITIISMSLESISVAVSISPPLTGGSNVVRGSRAIISSVRPGAFPFCCIFEMRYRASSARRASLSLAAAGSSTSPSLSAGLLRTAQIPMMITMVITLAAISRYVLYVSITSIQMRKAIAARRK